VRGAARFSPTRAETPIDAAPMTISTGRDFSGRDF
jgi:hypothetical protein